MPKVTHDLCAVVGKFTDNQGKTKNRYVNAGGIMLMDDGKELPFINKSFNPAGCLSKEGSEFIFLSRFEKKDNAQQPQKPQPVQQSRGADGIEDQDIPF